MEAFDHVAREHFPDRLGLFLWEAGSSGLGCHFGVARPIDDDPESGAIGGTGIDNCHASGSAGGASCPREIPTAIKLKIAKDRNILFYFRRETQS
jgi:hypothetical protein